MPIRKLPRLLVNQIAAGEVIDRPASVVKELIENSLDAGATKIDILVEDGGRQLVRANDNGFGIRADELVLAVEPHATSKLESAELLGMIETLGFRGEALASIASVSRLRVVSRPTIDGAPVNEAAVIEASGDQVSEPAPTGGAPGTTVEIRDLFFNTPARRKFMRAAATEFGHINDAVTRVAMVHNRVSFTLWHGSRQVLDLAATDSRRQRCTELLGQELAEALLEFESNTPPQPTPALATSGQTPGTRPETAHSSVWGLAGMPSIARATAKYQYLCLNGRPIRDRGLSHAIKEAYRGLIPPDRQPVAVVLLDVDPHQVDLNVHPTKAEVRFRDPNRVHGLVLTALRQRLLGADLTPAAIIPDQIPSTLITRPPEKSFSTNTSNRGQPISSSDAFVDSFRRMDLTQKGFVYQQVRELLAKEDPDTAKDQEPPMLTAGLPGNAPTPDTPPPSHHPSRIPTHVLQLHKSYIVTEDEEGIVIVDQHALHERVMFEQLCARVFSSDGKLESQRLLMPVIMDLGEKHQALIEELAPLLERIGIEAVPAGPVAIGIQAFPSFLFDRKVSPSDFIKDLLDRAEEGQLDFASADSNHLPEAVLQEVLNMMACKAAIKAGDQMGAEELEQLLEQRNQIERSSNCPHGRPTSIRLSLRELEKQFKRT